MSRRSVEILMSVAASGLELAGDFDEHVGVLVSRR